MRALTVLGSTGSIGRQTLDIVAAFPGRFHVRALAAGRDVARLAQQVRQVGAETAVIGDAARLPELRAALRGTGTRALAGMDGLLEVARDPGDLLVAAMVGAVGLRPLLAAVEAGRTVALANKEPLAAAGALVMAAAARGGATLLPVDSEPSAIFQCLRGQHRAGLARLWLTASGGAFRDCTAAALARVTPAQALAHPTWTMGPKITVDSATMMNKGLEVIEAHWLFGVPLADIHIVIHPQSLIHSLVEFRDGSLLAQLGAPSMHTPIQYALGYPERLPHAWAPLNLLEMGSLTFAAPDFRRFPCPALAREAALVGGTAPTCLNAANEAAVAAFLDGRIGFMDIPRLVERALAAHAPSATPTLEEVLAVDAETRALVRQWLP
ncbi:MAG TPA: 1-deoxy-D-xylulose-5-phosphate reductoisomerase [Armatimonadota bacterium]|nr:1-deoxy-D-xylulose-5-phosphate reductoisomerase [Armatimonadota bacterium]